MCGVVVVPRKNHREMKRQLIGQMGRFVVVGALATLLHYGLYYLLMKLMPAALAYAIGYVLSFVFNFFATSYFTFHASPSWKRLVGMLGAHGVNFLLHMGLFQLFQWMGMPVAWIPLPVYAVAVPVNFLLVRFVFTSPSSHP